MKRSATVIDIKRLRHALRDEIEAIYEKRVGQGEFSQEDVVRELEELLNRTDLYDFVEDLARGLARYEDHQRSSQSIPNQLELFTEEQAKRHVILLGEARRVYYADANWSHLMIRNDHQIGQLGALTKRMQTETSYRQRVADLMQHDAKITFGQAMKRLGLW